jgi:FkbM family methyltransferase
MLAFLLCLLGGTLDEEGARTVLASKRNRPCAEDSGELNLKASIVVTNTSPPYAICCRRNQLVDRVVRKVLRWEDCDNLPSLIAPSSPGARKLFVDVGANIGACSLLMAAHGHRVIAFEPVPQTYRALVSGFAANNFAHGAMVTLINAAASTSAGPAVIYTRRGNAGHSYTKGVTNRTSEPSNNKFISFDIEVTTLDSIVREPVELMKIDTQGHELMALRGATALLATHGVKTIAFEFGPGLMEAAGERGDPVALLRLLHSHGYQIRGHPQADSVVDPADFDKFVGLVRAGWRKPGDSYLITYVDLVAIKTMT